MGAVTLVLLIAAALCAIGALACAVMLHRINVNLRDSWTYEAHMERRLAKADLT